MKNENGFGDYSMFTLMFTVFLICYIEANFDNGYIVMNMIVLYYAACFIIDVISAIKDKKALKDSESEE